MFIRNHYFIKFMVLILVIEVSCLIRLTHCNVVDTYQPFGLMYCLCVQDSDDSILKT